jgi:hypothetical protein
MNKNVFGKIFTVFGAPFLFCINLFAQDPNFHIYLCFGQSNMAGAGTIENQDKTVNSRFQMMEPMDCPGLNRSFGKWYPAVPPLWGCTGGIGPADYFGRTMVQTLSYDIKVGVIVIGIPGCDIRLFDKKDYKGFDTYNNIPSKYSGSAYKWLIEMAKSAQKDGVIKGMLMHQGETMPDTNAWLYNVKSVYDSLISDLGLIASRTPLLAGEVLYVNKGGEQGAHNAIIARMPSVIHNSYVISADGLTGKDQWHFTSASYRTFGARYAEKMLSLPDTVTTNIANNSVVFPKKMHPNRISVSSCKKGALRIISDDNFSYRIINGYGAVAEAGHGRHLLVAGTSLSPGIYLLSITDKTGLFTKNLLVR